MKFFEKTIQTIANLYRKAGWKVARFFYRVEVHVYPKSPYFPAHTEVLAVFLNKFAYESATVRTNMDRDGHIDAQSIFDEYPGLHRLQVHYPDDWFDRLDHFRQSRAKQQGKHKPIKEDNYR